MYISEMSITGYKNAKEKSTIKFNEGLNVLVGENGSGKTTIINALRLILRENEFSYMNISEDDFYISLDKKSSSDKIKIDLTFESLTPDEEVTFLTWCDADFKALLHLEVNSNPNRKGYYKKEIWGGNSKSSIFEDETFDCIDCIYLPPLRDAEEKLTNGKKSRLAQLLKKQYGDQKEILVNSVKEFNDNITNNTDGKYNEISLAKSNINGKLNETLGQRLGQSINLQFADTSFSKIVESIKMVFFPNSNETDPNKFRDIATNSLGYNNLLYIATVFAELELLKDNNLMTVLLIEEPEAHLHPQLQVKFIKYLQEMSESLSNTQIFITTHSPVLASSISIDKLVHIVEKGNQIISTPLGLIQLGDSKNYLERWLDVTKSTLLFSKGIILVEGISEAMLIPVFAKVVLAKYNKAAIENSKQLLPNSLEEAGVSTININGINFKHFMKLFSCLDDSTDEVKLPLFCSGITDNDPPKDVIPIYDKDGELKKDKDGDPLTKSIEVYPLPSNRPLGSNSALSLIDKINKSRWGRLYGSPLKTFEYDIAMEKNTKIMARTLKELWPTKDGKITKFCDEIISRDNNYTDETSLSNDSKFLLEHIDNDEVGKGVYAQAFTDLIDLEINGELKGLNKDKSNLESILENISKIVLIPKYLEDAILWACGGETGE
ncbi:ATP-dependent nuclease [Paenibacillus sp. Soil750]|uniref:ATP-dependent nuclease n=1 Tax=Paenibacillus sp. Soil750 TaxID=1736398 RepID=UPI0006FA99AA|nr:AAA family ATPase [Paenibacillus sp. Soil750]KRE73923.1 chromosome segregation protein SMC [Paenibacillus sp. Soil750]